MTIFRCWPAAAIAAVGAAGQPPQPTLATTPLGSPAWPPARPATTGRRLTAARNTPTLGPAASPAGRDRIGTLSSGLPLAVGTRHHAADAPHTVRHLSSQTQASAWPCATIQPPAITGPSAPRTSSSHRVPEGIPLTCAWTCSPHGCAAYRTVAAVPVRRSLPVTRAVEASPCDAGSQRGGRSHDPCRRYRTASGDHHRGRRGRPQPAPHKTPAQRHRPGEQRPQRRIGPVPRLTAPRDGLLQGEPGHIAGLDAAQPAGSPASPAASSRQSTHQAR